MMQIARTTAALAPLLGLGLVMGPVAADAADTPTCRGEVATVVGVFGENFTGTEGRDVIVTNGQSGDALGGDDLICLTGDGGGIITAGAGNDTVESHTEGGPLVDLGPGNDTFSGSPGNDRVVIGHEAGERDVVTLGDGSDYVEWAGPGSYADQVDLGAGDDRIGLPPGLSLTPAAVVNGGEGVDRVIAHDATAGEYVFDTATGRLVSGAPQHTAQVASFETFTLVSAAPGVSLEWTGTDGVDELAVYGRHQVRVNAEAGAGDDFVDVINGPAAGSSFDGGAGRDQIGLGDQATTPRKSSYVIDLEKGKLTSSSVPGTMRLTGFEDAHVVANRVEIHGTDGPNTLYAVAQTSVLEGRKGADDLAHGADRRWEMFKRAKPERSTQRGGPGRDTLTGSHGRDLLIGAAGNDTLTGRNRNDRIIGGPGRDKADGGAGTDTCRAERKKRCER